MDRLTKFEKKVLKLLKKVSKGQVITYGALARAVGRPKAARAVGNALNKNPNLIKCPCHRVVKSDGQVGGYARGEKEKIRLLKSEGVLTEKGRIKDFKKVLFNLR